MKFTKQILSGCLTALMLLGTTAVSQSAKPSRGFRTNIPVDSIYMSDPAIIADPATGTYYMTGTGGRMYIGKSLGRWDGPYDVVEQDTATWMGAHPQIWAAEIHKIGDKYYYFATFTNNKVHNAVTPDGAKIPRRSSHVLVSDRPDGPYRNISDRNYTPENRPTLDGTYWRDADGKNYMVFCGEWLYNDNGTMEYVELADDLSGAVGEPVVMFRASDSPWSNEIVRGKKQFNRVTDGPWLFRTDTGRLGMIWTSWKDNNYTTGVAYSESGTLAGPWIQGAQPVLMPNFGHGMFFRDLDGKLILSVHSHADPKGNGHYERHPSFWEVDLSGDTLKIGKRLRY